MGSLLLSRPATVPRQAQRPDTLCNQQVRCSSHPTSSKMNDPTQFEQVDETCRLGRVVLYSKSLGMAGVS